jgi:hypothetical protein
MDSCLIEHFYGLRASELTLPEFLARLEGIGYVREQLRPKTPAELTMEIAAEQAREMAEAMKRKAQNDG